MRMRTHSPLLTHIGVAETERLRAHVDAALAEVNACVRAPVRARARATGVCYRNGVCFAVVQRCAAMQCVGGLQQLAAVSSQAVRRAEFDTEAAYVRCVCASLRARARARVCVCLCVCV